MKIFIIMFSFFTLSLLNSCVSMTGLEEGRTLGENNSEVGISANLITSPDVLGNDIDIDGDIYYIPMIEATYKYGVLQNLDIGGRINTTLNAGAYAKYQVLGDRTSKFALSSGIELSTFAGLGYAVHIPVYTSFHPSDKVSMYFNPKFVYQFGIVDMTIPVNYFGGNVGLMFGQRHKFGIDLGIYSIGSSENSDRASLVNVGFGGKFRFGDFSSQGIEHIEDEKVTRRRNRR